MRSPRRSRRLSVSIRDRSSASGRRPGRGRRPAASLRAPSGWWGSWTTERDVSWRGPPGRRPTWSCSRPTARRSCRGRSTFEPRMVPFGFEVPDSGGLVPGEYAVRVRLTSSADSGLVVSDTARVVLSSDNGAWRSRAVAARADDGTSAPAHGGSAVLSEANGYASNTPPRWPVQPPPACSIAMGSRSTSRCKWESARTPRVDSGGLSSTCRLRHSPRATTRSRSRRARRNRSQVFGSYPDQLSVSNSQFPNFMGIARLVSLKMIWELGVGSWELTLTHQSKRSPSMA